MRPGSPIPRSKSAYPPASARILSLPSSPWIPEIAGRAHIEAITRVTHQALEEAGITVDQLGAVAVTAFPGLIGALLVGVNFAKSLAFANDIPLVAVNHIKAHVAAAYLTDATLEP
ncbi:MAG: hypothetical protein II330_07230, partial [Clostridia bacterium]|nr:hypothetical protein [Clostridia bacterium]